MPSAVALWWASSSSRAPVESQKVVAVMSAMTAATPVANTESSSSPMRPALAASISAGKRITVGGAVSRAGRWDSPTGGSPPRIRSRDPGGGELREKPARNHGWLINRHLHVPLCGGGRPAVGTLTWVVLACPELRRKRRAQFQAARRGRPGRAAWVGQPPLCLVAAEAPFV